MNGFGSPTSQRIAGETCFVTGLAHTLLLMGRRTLKRASVFGVL